MNQRDSRQEAIFYFVMGGLLLAVGITSTLFLGSSHDLLLMVGAGILMLCLGVLERQILRVGQGDRAAVGSRRVAQSGLGVAMMLLVTLHALATGAGPIAWTVMAIVTALSVFRLVASYRRWQGGW